MKLNAFYRQQLIWPFWDSGFNLLAYLDSVTLAKQEKNQTFRKKLIFQQTIIIFFLLTVRCTELLYISFVELTTDFWKHLFHDYSLYLFSRSSVNILAFLFAAQALVFTFKMHFFNYNANHFETLIIVRQILFFPRYKSSLFLKNRVKMKQKIVFVSDQIRKHTSLYLKAPIYLYIITFFTLSYFNVRLLTYVFQHLKYFLFNFSGLLSLTFALLNAFLSNYTFIRFAIVNITFSVIIFTFTQVIFARLRQANKLLNRKRKLESKSFQQVANFLKFAAFHSQTLVLVTAGNGYFGFLMLHFLVLYMPNNAYTSVQLIKGSYPFASAFIIGNAHAFEYIVAFGFHALCSMYSSRLHRCSRLLLSLQANKQFNSLLVKLKLAHYIEKFHTSNCYGITYSDFCLISYESLFKVSLCAFKMQFF